MGRVLLLILVVSVPYGCFLSLLLKKENLSFGSLIFLIVAEAGDALAVGSTQLHHAATSCWPSCHQAATKLLPASRAVTELLLAGQAATKLLLAVKRP